MSAAQLAQLLGGGVGREGRFVELHPLRPGSPQLHQQLGVGVQQLGQFLQGPESSRSSSGGLGQQQEGERTEQHRSSGHPGFQRLLEVLHGGAVGEREPRLRADFRHQVVVVGVEPLRHLQRWRGFRTAGHGEVGVQRAEAQFGVALGHGAEGDGGVQHVVVVGERAAGDGVQAGTAQFANGGDAQFPGGGAQFRFAGAGRPVGLQGSFELPLGSDARVAEDGRSDFRCQSTHLASSTSWTPRSRGARAPAGRRGATAPARWPGTPAIPRASTRRAADAPMAGLRTRGRSRSHRGSYRPPLPRPVVQCLSRRARRGRLSFPLTAAGQFRIRTGFPLASPRAGADAEANHQHGPG